MTKWTCPSCKRTVTTYVALSSPPTCFHPKGNKHHLMVSVDKPKGRSTRLTDHGGGG